jgi:hypothetical protein
MLDTVNKNKKLMYLKHKRFVTVTLKQKLIFKSKEKNLSFSSKKEVKKEEANVLLSWISI